MELKTPEAFSINSNPRRPNMNKTVFKAYDTLWFDYVRQFLFLFYAHLLAQYVSFGVDYATVCLNLLTC